MTFEKEYQASLERRVINGHIVVDNPSFIYWEVDDQIRCYTLDELAEACELTLSALMEVL